jgi:SAM-dependent methyltransferase
MSHIIFDRNLLVKHRNRSAVDLNNYDFLYQLSAEDLVSRLDDMTAKFPIILDLGTRNGLVSRIINERDWVKEIIHTNLSFKMLNKLSGDKLVCDEEFIPFADNSFDLIVSVLNLHNVNDLPGTLIQLRRILKPEGLFLASIFGPETLIELKEAMFETELKLNIGVSPHISPFIDIKTAANLMQRAGFAIPVTDNEIITTSYSSTIKLMHDLRFMGESNILANRSKKYLGKEFFITLEEIYRKKFSYSAEEIKASFEIITMTGSK